MLNGTDKVVKFPTGSPSNETTTAPESDPNETTAEPGADQYMAATVMQQDAQIMSLLQRVDRLEGIQTMGEQDFLRDFLDARFEHIDYVLEEFKEETKCIRQGLKEVKEDNKITRRTTIITGISVVLGLGAIVVAIILSIAQIQTSWITALAQILSK